MNRFGVNTWMLGGVIKMAKEFAGPSAAGIRLQIGVQGSEKETSFNAVVWEPAVPLNVGDQVVLQGVCSNRKYVNADGSEKWVTECNVNGRFQPNVQIISSVVPDAPKEDPSDIPF
jgi:hypothetical protein